MPSDSDSSASSSATADALSAAFEASVTTPDDTGAAPGPADQDAPASPSDAPVDDHAALLQAVQKVVGKPDSAAKIPEGEAAAAGPEQPDDGAAQATPAAPDPLDSDPDAQELAGIAPKTRKRIDRLLEQRNAARTELESLKDPANRWMQLNGYLQEHKLAAEDVNLLLGIGAALRRGDMRAFRDGIAPYWQLANEALGDFLPTDLQAKVETGEITLDVAREVSQMRHANARLNGQAQLNQQEINQAAQARVQSQVHDAIANWEQQIIRRDPDYARKAGAVLRISQALMAEHGAPQTPETAVAMAQRAYEEAGGWVGRLSPQPTRPVPDSTRVVNGARAEPRDLMEVAMRALDRPRVSH